MTCLAVISDEEEDPILDDEPVLKDLRVVLQHCDDLISRKWLLVDNVNITLLMHTVS